MSQGEEPLLSHCAINEDQLGASSPVHAADGPSPKSPDRCLRWLRSLRSHLRAPSMHELIATARKGQRFLLTVTMAVIDVEDRVHLAVIASAGVAALACGVYVQARYDYGYGPHTDDDGRSVCEGHGYDVDACTSMGCCQYDDNYDYCYRVDYCDGRSPSISAVCAATVLVAAIALLAVLRAFSKIVEGMDVYAQKYAKLRETELGDREDDELGPAPFAHEGPLMQPGERTTEEELLARAHAAEDSFRDEVVLVLAEPESEPIGPNVKGIDRAKEKVRLQCDGDARLLRDVLRCSIICPTIDALCVSSAKLGGMRVRGLVQILEVSSRKWGRAARH